jgi:hypothetical protein
MSTWRVVAAWLVLAIVMSLNGALRELYLRRTFGSTQSDVISAALGVIIILLVTRPFFRPLANRPLAQIVRVSLSLVALTVAFEFLFGRYDEIWNGRPWPALLALVAATPFLWGRWFRVRVDHAMTRDGP